jgi:intracellular sulfur oxidation DsrE/DsrF family protein
MNSMMNQMNIGKYMALALLFCLLTLPAQAGEATGEITGDKPFAEARVVLQLSEGGTEYQSRVLSVANNLIKHYGGPDFVDIEIVAFGPGIALLYADNENLERISSLGTNGVRFIGCMNTMDTIERTTGARPELNPLTIPVQTGVAHLVERASQGFVVVRP